MKTMAIWVALALGVMSLAPTVSHAYGTLQLSRTSVDLEEGEDTNITASNYSGRINVTGNTDAFVAEAFVSGNTIRIEAQEEGTTHITVCTYDNTCNTIFVDVEDEDGDNNDDNDDDDDDRDELELEDNSVDMDDGETLNIRISGADDLPFIDSNSDDDVVDADVTSRTNLRLFARDDGSSTVRVCSDDDDCDTIRVNVDFNDDDDDDDNGDDLELEDNDVEMDEDDTLNIRISGSDDFPFIDSNSDDDVVDADITSRTNLRLVARDEGSSTITVCSDSDGCDSVDVEVDEDNDDDDNDGDLELDDEDLEMEEGDEETVSISGGSGDYYISSISDDDVVSAAIFDDEIEVSAEEEGSSNIRICDFDNDCVTLRVEVDEDFDDDDDDNDSDELDLSDDDLDMEEGDTETVFIDEGSGDYFIDSNSNDDVARARISDDELRITAEEEGTTRIRVCDDDDEDNCVTLRVNVDEDNFDDDNGQVGGILIYSNGSLVNDNGTIYAIYKDTKSGFSSMFAFHGLGFRSDAIIYGSTSGLSNTGYVINSSNVPHPWGSWVKSGNTVYFVHEDGLIPVPSYDVFLNNGGADNKIVSMNWQDSGKQTLSVMRFDDSRLRP